MFWESDDMPGDEVTQRMHEDLLMRNASDIQSIKKDMIGLAKLEEKFSNMEGWLKSISSDIKNFIEKTENKFQTKEMCDVCMQTSEKQYSELVRIYENRVQDLKDTYTKAIDKIEEAHKTEIEQMKKDFRDECNTMSNRMWGAAILVISGLATIAWALTKTHIIEVVK